MVDIFNFHSTAQSNAVGGPLRDLTDGSAPKTSKSDFASNVSRFFESRKIKVAKNPPPPPARITKVMKRFVDIVSATTQNSAALEKVGQKLVSLRGSGPFYDDAWDIRLAHFGLQTSESAQQQRQHGGRGPPDGAATCESTCSLTSPPSSAKAVALSSTTVTDSDVGKVVTASITPVNATISTFTSSAPHAASQSDNKFKATPTGKGDTVFLPAETDPADGVATPTPLNNANWFPPPPPTPLHLSMHADEMVDSQPGRYHEHRRSFELDDDQKEAKVDPGDAITLPPLSPTSPSQENTSVNGSGRTPVPSFLLNLPPPPPVTDLPTEQPPSPPAIPPRDPKTSITTLTDPPITDLDGQPPVSEAAPIAKVKDDSERAKVLLQSKPGVDGRSVIPWERVAPPTDIDFSGNLPQWVPPQHSEAAVLHQRVSRSIGHRSSKSQSGCEDLTNEDPNSGPLGLAAGGRSQSQHRRRRRTTRSFGDDFADVAETPTNGSSGSRRAVRMNSDSSGMAKARTLVATGDVWAAPVACDGG
ncbi:unnamed protein product [Hydatigera taeniaeformis]|uniref:SH3 domain-containing protein n=1 Tax=Hydatigena taeniaeformis TaxID=6205 RepID=A0A158RDX3_HYDTA|nr:unnamed protein product [Hydatigera taeniaeformis]